MIKSDIVRTECQIKVPVAQPPEQLEHIGGQILKALEILPISMPSMIQFMH